MVAGTRTAWGGGGVTGQIVKERMVRHTGQGWGRDEDNPMTSAWTLDSMAGAYTVGWVAVGAWREAVAAGELSRR